MSSRVELAGANQTLETLVGQDRQSTPQKFNLRGLDFCSCFGMKDHPASWRMPTPKQMEKLAAEADRKASAKTPTRNNLDIPPLWCI
jgi:hypothetical protein